MAGSDLVNPLESHDFPVEATTSPIQAGSSNNRSGSRKRDGGHVGVSIGVGTDFWDDSSDQRPWRETTLEPRTLESSATPKRGVNAGTDPIDFDADLFFRAD
jgi:hypothetical protein